MQRCCNAGVGELVRETDRFGHLRGEGLPQRDLWETQQGKLDGRLESCRSVRSGLLVVFR